jgi:hypothetical protein
MHAKKADAGRDGTGCGIDHDDIDMRRGKHGCLAHAHAAAAKNDRGTRQLHEQGYERRGAVVVIRFHARSLD